MGRGCKALTLVLQFKDGQRVKIRSNLNFSNSLASHKPLMLGLGGSPILAVASLFADWCTSRQLRSDRIKIPGVP
jgi:hypothetical protein